MTWLNGYGSPQEPFGVDGVPTTFVVGADGKIVWNDYDEHKTLEQAIDEALEAAAKKKE